MVVNDDDGGGGDEQGGLCIWVVLDMVRGITAWQEAITADSRIAFLHTLCHCCSKWKCFKRNSREILYKIRERDKYYLADFSIKGVPPP